MSGGKDLDETFFTTVFPTEFFYRYNTLDYGPYLTTIHHLKEASARQLNWVKRVFKRVSRTEIPKRQEGKLTLSSFDQSPLDAIKALDVLLLTKPENYGFVEDLVDFFKSKGFSYFQIDYIVGCLGDDQTFDFRKIYDRYERTLSCYRCNVHYPSMLYEYHKLDDHKFGNFVKLIRLLEKTLKSVDKEYAVEYLAKLLWSTEEILGLSFQDIRKIMSRENKGLLVYNSSCIREIAEEFSRVQE